MRHNKEMTKSSTSKILCDENLHYSRKHLLSVNNVFSLSLKIFIAVAYKEFFCNVDGALGGQMSWTHLRTFI